jgi:hypothetical protein
MYKAGFCPATAVFQANSCLQGEGHCAAELIAAECLNDGFPQTRQLAVEPDIPATDLLLEKQFCHPGEQVSC